MVSSSETTVNQSGERSWGACRVAHSGKANWSGFNTAAMVLSFIFFWPIGLLVMFWILSGREAKDLPAAIRDKWHELRGGKFSMSSTSENRIFNDFQQTQYDRIKEIKDEIGARAKRFNEFQEDAKRRADQDEFNRFMASHPER